MSGYLIASFALIVVMVFWSAYLVRANRRVFIQTILFGVGLLAFGGVALAIWPP